MSRHKRRRLGPAQRLEFERATARRDLFGGEPARMMRAIAGKFFDHSLSRRWVLLWREEHRREPLDDEERAVVHAAARNWPGAMFEPLMQVVYDARDVDLAAVLCEQHSIVPQRWLSAALHGRTDRRFFSRLAALLGPARETRLDLDPLRCGAAAYQGRTIGLVGAWWDLTLGAEPAATVPQHVYNDLRRFVGNTFGAHELRVLLRHWDARIRCPTRQTVGERLSEFLAPQAAYFRRPLRRLWLETLYALAPLGLPVHVADALVRATFPPAFAPLLAAHCAPAASVPRAQAAHDFFA